MERTPAATFCMLALTAALLTAGVTTAQGAPPAANVVLDRDAPDTTPWLRVLPSVQFCFLDDNGDGSYNPAEPVSLRPNGCQSVAGAVRFTAFGALPEGAFMRAGDADGRAQTQFPDPPSVRYRDVDSNGRISAGDTVYLDTLNPTAGRVEVGDVRLTPLGDAPAGRHVMAGDDDAGASVGEIGQLADLFAFADPNGNSIFDTGDNLYLRHQGGLPEGIVHLNDLRMGGSPAETFGTWVRLGDADAPARLRQIAAPSFCLAKAASGYVAGDTVVFRATGGCTGETATGDLAVSGPSGGSRLASDDAAVGLPLHALSAELRFREANGLSGYGVGDGLYLELGGRGAAIDEGDVRLTPWDGLPAAASARTGDKDVGLRTDAFGALGEHMSFVDVDGSGVFDRDDMLYVNRDGGTRTDIEEDVERGDTRLGVGPAGFFFGSQVTTGSPEIVLRVADRGFVVCVLDEDGDGAYDAGESVYLEPFGCTDISVNAVRMVAVEDHPPGSKVTAGEEAGNPLRAPAYDVVFHDRDLSGAWTVGDTLYLKFGSSAGQVRVGDVRVSPFGDLAGGQLVGSADADHNVNVVSLGSSLDAMSVYVDVDQNQDYGEVDLVYLDPAASTAESASIGMIRMTALAAPQPEPEVAPRPSPTESPGMDPTTSPSDPASPSPDPTTPGQSLTDAPSPGEEEDAEPPRTPGPGILLVLAAIGAVLWASRRSR